MLRNIYFLILFFDNFGQNVVLKGAFMRYLCSSGIQLKILMSTIHGE